MKLILICFSLFQSLTAVTFRIDYTFDSNHFFGDPNNPNDGLKERRDAIEAVADFFSEIIQDQFLEIDPEDPGFAQSSWSAVFFNPSTGNLQSVENLIIPEDEVVIYVGARELGGNVVGQAAHGGFSGFGFSNWFTRIRTRGQAGAANDDPSKRDDFAIWGGSIAFDTPRNWNFSLTENQSGTEFISTAIHEFCHVLGIGTSDSWENLITSDDLFIGEAVVRSFGGSPRVQTANSRGTHGHFENPSLVLTSPSYGSFGGAHGTTQRVRMLPAGLDTGNNFDVMSDLDLAALVDIGWEIALPAQLKALALGPSANSFCWLSSSFFDYQMMRSVAVSDGFTGESPLFEGSGLTQGWTDPNPLIAKAFYRLEAIPVFPASNLTIPNEIPQPGDEPSSLEEEPTLPVGGCTCTSICSQEHQP